MVKMSEIKDTFESIVEATHRATFIVGEYPFSRWESRLVNSFKISVSKKGSMHCICLNAIDADGSLSVPLSISYPMSYKSAHRLICSL